MHKIPITPSLFLSFPFPPFFVFFLLFSFFISSPLGIQKNSLSNWRSVVVWESHEPPTLPLSSASHSLENKTRQNVAVSALPLSSAFLSSENKTRQNAAVSFSSAIPVKTSWIPSSIVVICFLLSYIPFLVFRFPFNCIFYDVLNHHCPPPPFHPQTGSSTMYYCTWGPSMQVTWSLLI